MNTDHLRFFVATVDTGSYAAAGRFLHVSPEGVSHGVRALEQTVKAPLIVRKDGRTIPTDEGARIYQGGVAILEVLDRLKAESPYEHA